MCLSSLQEAVGGTEEEEEEEEEEELFKVSPDAKTTILFRNRPDNSKFNIKICIYVLNVSLFVRFCSWTIG